MPLEISDVAVRVMDLVLVKRIGNDTNSWMNSCGCAQVFGISEGDYLVYRNLGKGLNHMPKLTGKILMNKQVAHELHRPPKASKHDVGAA